MAAQITAGSGGELKGPGEPGPGPGPAWGERPCLGVLPGQWFSLFCFTTEVLKKTLFPKPWLNKTLAAKIPKVVIFFFS